LVIPDAKDDQHQKKITGIMKEFLDLAGKTESAGHGKDTIFIVAEADNADNFRLVNFLDVVDDEPPTYRHSLK